MRLFLQFIIITLLCSAQSINEQLKELEHAPPQKRVELMNHIKEQLILMNQEQRVQTINKLRAKLQPHTDRETHQIVPMQMRNNRVHFQQRQQTNIEHQESQRHIIDIKNSHTSSHQEPPRGNQPTIEIHTEQPIVQTHTEEPRNNQPTVQTHTEQPRDNQPTVQTHTEQPRDNQPTVQTHTEQPRDNQPTVQTHTEEPRDNQPTIQTHTEEPRINQPNSQSGRGER